MLVRELGIEPGKELQQLQEAVLAGNLPARRTALITAPEPPAMAGQPAAPGSVTQTRPVHPDPGSGRQLAPSNLAEHAGVTGALLSCRWWRWRHSAWLLPAILGLGLAAARAPIALSTVTTIAAVRVAGREMSR